MGLYSTLLFVVIAAVGVRSGLSSPLWVGWNEARRTRSGPRRSVGHSETIQVRPKDLPRHLSRASGCGASACSWLAPRTIRKGRPALAAFLQGLQQLGWTEGRNVRIDTRWAAAMPTRIRRYAAELVALAPDVILASGTPDRGAVATGDPHRADRVRIVVPDPVGAGFVESLARPGGNATGFTQFEYGI